jgi:betaine-homocysteine S-methyltransferase
MARLKDGAVFCAEGFVFELERRGYLQAGSFVPEVLFEHPEVVEQLHMDFVHAGSDVTQALTSYVHREKLRVIGREKDLAPMNRAALGIAKRVARRTGTLFAGDLCNTNIYDPSDSKAIKEVERIFDERAGGLGGGGGRRLLRGRDLGVGGRGADRAQGHPPRVEGARGRHLRNAP